MDKGWWGKYDNEGPKDKMRVNRNTARNDTQRRYTNCPHDVETPLSYSNANAQSKGSGCECDIDKTK